MKDNIKQPRNDDALSMLTSDDFDEIRKRAPLNKYGFPLSIPLKNKFAKNVLIKVVDGKISDLKGQSLSNKSYCFDILESEEFDSENKEQLAKLDFLFALFSQERKTGGAIYFKGKFCTDKIDRKFKTNLMWLFMDRYFHSEDKEIIESCSLKADVPLCYLPTKTKSGKKVIFRAYKATIQDKQNKNLAKDSYTFEIFQGDLFDLNSKDDISKITVIKSLLDKDKEVKGFYYKGKLLPSSLTEEFRLYLEKSFVKKNFSVEDKDYILMNVTKDRQTGYPLFYPMRDRQNHPISISVLNADVELLGYDKKFSNFNIIADHSFNLKDEEDKIKLKIVQSLFFHKTILTGALYLDGMLIPSSMSKSEVERRRIKAENATGIYLNDNEDFIRINSRFTVEDRFRLLQLTDYFDQYYPDNLTFIPQSLNGMKHSDILVRFDRVNIVSEDGDYIFDHDFSMDYKKGDKFEDKKSEALIYIVRAFYSKDVKIRGAIYYKGSNILPSKFRKNRFKKEFLEKILDEKTLSEIKKNPIQQYKYRVDKKTGMLEYFPTTDRTGKEILLSVVSANIYFGSGKNVVKASQNLNFDIHVGETFGLVGESGSGKTTISRAILGINKLHSGAIYFKGKLISKKLTKQEEKQSKKNIQMIFQDPAASLNERANIDYIVSEGLYNFHLFKSKEERISKVTEIMESVGLLPEHLSRYPHEFSGGQRQRIGIARALVIEPELILADEPISALDVSIRAQVLNLLRKLQEEKNLTYLFIAHDLSIIRYISDRIAVMHQGHIVELGNAEDIYKDPIHPYTKALLTAIPQPDPKTNGSKQKYVYHKANLDYEKCHWCEMKPGHFVLVPESKKGLWEKGEIENKYLSIV